MNNPETSRNTGAIYIANVLVALPPLAEVQEANADLQRYDDDWAEQEFQPDEEATSVFATVSSLDGSVPDAEINAWVAHCEPGSPYVVLQHRVGDEDVNGFDGFFSDTIDDGEFGLHTAHEADSGIWVVPVEACGAKEPVRAVAALCLGTEALEYRDRPSPEQIEALFVAAQIALGDIER